MRGASSRSRWAEVRRLGHLAGPAALTQLGYVGLGAVDTAMLGRVGAEELGAAALGNLWSFGTATFAMGILLGMDPLVSQAHGARDVEALGRTLQRALLVAVALSVPVGLSWMGTEAALGLLDLPPRLRVLAARYVQLQLPSLLPFLLFHCLRQYLQGRGIVAPALWVILGANVCNAVANWVLVFGHCGFAAHGLEGAAVATCLTRFVLCLGLVACIVGLRLHRGGWVPWSAQALAWKPLVHLARLGVPVGLQSCFEVWAFQAVTVLAGHLPPHDLAAHVIVLNVSSIAFMVPLGLSAAASTRVGNLLGARHPRAADRTAAVALCFAVVLAVGSGLSLVVLGGVLPTVSLAAVATALGESPLAISTLEEALAQSSTEAARVRIRSSRSRPSWDAWKSGSTAGRPAFARSRSAWRATSC